MDENKSAAVTPGNYAEIEVDSQGRITAAYVTSPPIDLGAEPESPPSVEIRLAILELKTGHFRAVALDFPGCHTDAATIDEAKERLPAAVAEWLRAHSILSEGRAMQVWVLMRNSGTCNDGDHEVEVLGVYATANRAALAQERAEKLNRGRFDDRDFCIYDFEMQE